MEEKKEKGPEGQVCSGGGERRPTHNASQRLVIMDLMTKSGLSLKGFSEIVGIPYTTLVSWKNRYEKDGPDGLMEKPRGSAPGESQLPEVTRRAIVMIRQAHPEYGCERISDMLGRGPGLGASPGAVLRVIRESGLEVEPPLVPRHKDVPRTFERSRPNQLWQTDIFTFTLKRENRRLYLVVFLDDHSRYVVGYGLHASMGGALVVEALRAAIGAYGAPEEVLTDNGPQYAAWRGKSRFSKELETLGIRHLLARPRHPQTVGKTERFWGTLWKECVSGAVFLDVQDARRRVGQFIDHYNFQRPHQGIDGLVPADRYFEAKDEVKRTLAGRVASNALSLAKDGVPRKPFYLTGRVGDVDLSIHAEGERVVLNTADGRREEVDLRAPGRRAEGVVEGVPEPVAVHDEADEREVSDGEEGEEPGEGTEEDDAACGERGGEASGGWGLGGDERGAGPFRGVGGVGDLVDEVLRAGGKGASGHGGGVGAPAAGTKDGVADRRAGEGRAGEGRSSEGPGADAGLAAAGEEERAHRDEGQGEEEATEGERKKDGSADGAAERAVDDRNGL